MNTKMHLSWMKVKHFTMWYWLANIKRYHYQDNKKWVLVQYQFCPGCPPQWNTIKKILNEFGWTTCVSATHCHYIFTHIDQSSEIRERQHLICITVSQQQNSLTIFGFTIKISIHPCFHFLNLWSFHWIRQV